MSSQAKPALTLSQHLEIRHQLPGRIRLHVPGLRDDPPLSARLTQALQQLDGVRRVRWNPACASLTVWHRRSGPLKLDELSQALHSVLEHRPYAPLMPITPPRPVVATRPTWMQRARLWSLRSVTRTATGSTQPTCRLCQLKLMIARWFFADVWRCWTHEWLTLPRSPLR